MDPENSIRSGPDFFSHQRISQNAIWTSLETQLDLMAAIASRGLPGPYYNS